MFNQQKVVVVMPAYNAEQTLVKTYQEVMAQDYVDDVILVDDASSDRTVELARSLDRVTVISHSKNRGYGGNQKTCYEQAISMGADIVVMVHPDYQYTPKLIPSMVSMIGQGLYACVLGSRIIGESPLKGGMPKYKYVANRFLTFSQNLLQGAKISEYHTGYRAFSRTLLEALPLEENSDDFVFDAQMLAQIIWYGFSIGEVSCPARYFAEASSINFSRSVKYGLGCLYTAGVFCLCRLGLARSRRFPRAHRRTYFRVPTA